MPSLEIREVLGRRRDRAQLPETNKALDIFPGISKELEERMLFHRQAMLNIDQIREEIVINLQRQAKH